MPGNEVVQKQSVLGGAAGIVLLAFALGYRFFPEMPRTPPPPIEPLPSTPLVARAPSVPAPIGTAGPKVTLPTTFPFDLGPLLPATPAPPPPKAIAALLRRADKAVAEGHLLEPKETSAFTLYQQVLEADRENAAAKAGIEKIHNLLLREAGDALDRGDEAESARLLAALAAFPTAGEEAAALEKRLATLRQVTPLLTHAADLLRQGHATTPPGTNALEVYRHVLKLDPGNKLADQGLAQIERGYLDRALAATAQDDFAGADEILGDASAIRPGSHELLDTRTRIESIRRQRAASVLAQANSALDANNPDLAALLGQKALGLSPDLAGIEEFNERLRNARLYANFKPGQVISDAFVDRAGHAPALVVVPTGKFTMGSPTREEGHRSSEEPPHEVRIDAGFALGRDDVTVAEFRQFVDDAGYVSDAEKLGGSSIYDEESGRMIERRGVTWRNDYLGVSATDNLPVIHVSWNDAKAYVLWLAAHTAKKYRLPSEAEFEYTLRAGSATRYWWGDGNPTSVVANLTGDGERSPHAHRAWANAFPHYNDKHWGPAPVGSFAPNRFGLRDIDGNVSIWTEDCWHDNYLRAPVDGKAWINPGCAEHVIRGGSWGSAPDQVRSAFRLAAPSDTRSARVGLRVARDL